MSNSDTLGMVPDYFSRYCTSHGQTFVFVGLRLLKDYGKWFKPGSISSSYSVIVWVRVALKRTVVSD